MSECSECDWNRFQIRVLESNVMKLEDKYDKIIHLLTMQVEDLQSEVIELRGQGGY